jgi:succinate dehydrogenase / fumarate reductase, cytochrome b subunit
MSTTITAHVNAASDRVGWLAKNHFLFRRLHSLTGIAFGLYLFLHLGINASLAEGARTDGAPTVFQEQVDKIHKLPFLTFIEIFTLYLPLAYHTFYGFYIIYTGQANVGRYGYTRNWLYVLQRVTALIIFFFAAFHIFTMQGWLPGTFASALEFHADEATRSTAEHLYAAAWIWAVAYPIGVLASAFHTANGFYSAAITWGLTISKQAQRRWGIFSAFLFVVLMGAGMTALIFGVITARQLQYQPAAATAPSGSERLH